MANGKAAAAIAAAITAGALMFPAFKHPRWTPQKERILAMAALVNARAAIYTNAHGGASIFAYQRRGYKYQERFEDKGYTPEKVTAIDTNDFRWYRGNRYNLQLVKDHWGTDISSYSPPTLDGDPDGNTYMPIVKGAYAFISSNSCPTNIWDYTPRRLLSGGGPYSNDTFIGEWHGYANASTINGGPFEAGTRDEWYTSDYGYDNTWKVMTNGWFTPFVAYGRVDKCGPFSVNEVRPVGGPVDFDDRFVQTESRLAEADFRFEVDSEVRYVFGVVQVPRNTTNVPSAVAVYDDLVSSLVNGTNVLYGSLTIETNTDFVIDIDNAGSGLGIYRDLPVGDPEKEYGWQPRLGTFAGDDGSLGPNENYSIGASAGVHGSRMYTNTTPYYPEVRLSQVRVSSVTFIASTNIFPAGEWLDVSLYAMCAQANSRWTDIDEGDMSGIEGRWGDTDVYNLVGTYVMSATNNTVEIISALEKEDNVPDFYDLIDGGYFLNKPSYPADVMGANGWGLDHFGVTVKLHIE